MKKICEKNDIYEVDENSPNRFLYSVYGIKNYSVASRTATKKNREKSRVLKDKKGGKCFLCGYSDNYASLDFHHFGKKEHTISVIIQTKPLEMVEREVEKCVLLCRNCHSDIHNPAQSKNPRKTMDKISRLPANENIKIQYVA